MKLLPIAGLALFSVLLSPVQPMPAAAQTAISQDVEIDLEMAGLERAISRNDHAAVLGHIEALRRLDPSLDAGELRFFEARAAWSLDQVDRAHDALTRFLAGADRESALYQEALHLMLDVRPAKAAADEEARRREAAAREEARRREEEARRREEEARRREEALRREQAAREEALRRDQAAREEARLRAEEAERQRALAAQAAAAARPDVPDWIGLGRDRCVLMVASRRTVGEARTFVRGMAGELADAARIFESGNGWFAVAVAAVRRDDAPAELARLGRQYGIPSDSFCSATDRFVREVFPDEAAPVPADYVATHRVYSQQSGYLNLRSGPGNDRPVIMRMDNGTEVVMVSDSVRGWVRILTADGQQGWAYSRYLEEL
ncbi:SH3 domain-containing protein [Polymorphum gilvum]|nr:SH3 domain-containing protein [Polymorphum gilvum]